MTAMRKHFTGRHMTAILVGFFALVIFVNVMMARFAISTFGGVVVENSYVASQGFNRWLDEAAKEKALGWQAKATREGDNRVLIALSGAPEHGVTMSAVARHPLGRMPDQTLAFVRNDNGKFVSIAVLPVGRWRLRVTATTVHDTWRSEFDVP